MHLHSTTANEVHEEALLHCIAQPFAACGSGWLEAERDRELSFKLSGDASLLLNQCSGPALGTLYMVDVQ